MKKWKVEYKGILELSIQSMIYLQGHRVPKFHHRDLYLKRIANTSRRGPQPCERDDRVKDSNLAGGGCGVTSLVGQSGRRDMLNVTDLMFCCHLVGCCQVYVGAFLSFSVGSGVNLYI